MSTTTTTTTTTINESGSTVTQYGFYYDQGRCVDCKTCTIACKVWYNKGPSPAKWCRTFEWESGTFPNVILKALFAPCYHCANPVCITNCPYHAIYKEPNFGAVLIDANACTGCRICFQVCPYGAPQFASDAPSTKAEMCTMCIDRLTTGLQPICVMTCSLRALDFGKLSDLQAKYGSIKDLDGLPSSKTTNPSIVFKARIDHKTLIPYDTARVAQLMAKRDPLPALYSTAADLTPNAGVVGRSTLNLKPDNGTAEKAATQNDEG